MPTDIAPGVIYLRREDWGANPAIRGGHPMNGAAEKVEIWVHHTVIVDRDATPDLWGTVAEVKSKMRQLQVIRADITDVPYNGVAFMMENGDLIVCEGRGSNRSGAHTIGHNRDGYGWAIEGDMETLPNPAVGLWVPKFNRFFGWLKTEELPRLGPFNYHQMVSATACPGVSVIPEVSKFRYTVMEGDDDMGLILLYDKDKPGAPRGARFFVSDEVRKRKVLDQEELNYLRFVGIPEQGRSAARLDAIPDA